MTNVPLRDFLLHTFVIIFTGLFLIYGYSVTTGVGINLYQCYANLFLHGLNFFVTHPDAQSYSECLKNIRVTDGAYSKLPAEYPLLSLIPMLIPMIAGNAL